MGYPVDLDELAETDLQHELLRRGIARSKGLCDYCGRPPTTPPCKYSARHSDPRIEIQQEPQKLVQNPDCGYEEALHRAGY